MPSFLDEMRQIGEPCFESVDDIPSTYSRNALMSGKIAWAPNGWTSTGISQFRGGALVAKLGHAVSLGLGVSDIRAGIREYGASHLRVVTARRAIAV
ncbi:hypothetical protein [Burkholderia territorii]|uniref:hypothetical protein n=1 Tax=Burkholderia territorii TaxID=1503055 RepID=UPI000AF61570|nr:hypothetical protein [Burkholderia territorii]